MFLFNMRKSPRLLILSCFISFAVGLLISNSSPAQSYVTSSVAAKSNFYKCMSMNIAIDSYTWTMFIGKSIPATVTSSMTLDQITQENKAKKELEKIIADIAQQNLSRFVYKTTNSLISDKATDIQQELVHAIRLFSRHLRLRLSQYKSENWIKPIKLNILFAPRSNKAQFNNDLQERQRLGVLGSDRFTLFSEDWLDTTTDSYNAQVAKVVEDGKGLLKEKALRCGSGGPFVMSALFSITLDPDIQKSTFFTQASVGMPLGKEITFAQQNDQIKFEKILLPNKINSASSADYPAALITLSADFSSTEVPILIQFGKSAQIFSEGWKSKLSEDIQREDVPRLRGTPNGIIASFFNVDFSVFTVSSVLDFSKYKGNDLLEINDLNLFISAGLNQFSNVKFGMFNKEDVDVQFKNEINKSIQNAIVKQKKEFNNKSLSEVSSKTGFSQSQLQAFVAEIFKLSDKR